MKLFAIKVLAALLWLESVTLAQAGLIAIPQNVGWIASAPPVNTLTGAGIASGRTNFFIARSPANGQLIQLTGFATNGQWQYTPTVTNAVDTDQFTFYVSDTSGNVSTLAVVSITVTNLPFAISQSIGWLPNGFTTNALSGLVTNGVTNFSIYQYPGNGLLVFQPGFATNGLWTYQPFSTNFTGSDQFAFQITDSQSNLSAPAWVSITVTNLPYAYGQTVSVLRGAPATNQLQGLVASGPTNFSIVRSVTNGILTLLTGFATNGQWQYQPTNAISNSISDSFTFHVTDSLSRTSAVAAVSINISNVPYAFSQSVGWFENTFPTNQLTGLVTNGPTNFAITRTPLYGQVVTLPGFATNGLWKYQPYGTNFSGADSFTFTVKDSNTNLSLPGLVSITVTNIPAAPFAHSVFLKTRPNQALAITLSGDDDGNDPNADTISYQFSASHTRDIREWNPVFTVLTQPSNGTLSGVVPDLTYTPSKTNVFDSFTFKVNNGQFDSAPATVMIRVAPYNIGTNYLSSFTSNAANVWHSNDVPLLNPGTVRPGFDGIALTTSNGTVTDSGSCCWSSATGRGDDTTMQVTNYLSDRLGRTRLFDLGGTFLQQFYIDNNGLISFGASEASYVSTPFPVAGATAIASPLWCDVDSRYTGKGGVVTLGAGYVNDGFNPGPPAVGRQALFITWEDVAGYNENYTAGLNRFQIVLIDRSDLRTGDYDAEMNYEYIEWLSAQSSPGQYPGAGFDSGNGVLYSNFPGALSASVTNLITNSDETPLVPGRFVVRLNNDSFPAITTNLAVTSSLNSLTANALINPNGCYTTTWFAASNTTTAAVTIVPAASFSAANGTNLYSINAQFNGLQAGATYVITAVGQNGFGSGSLGTNYGNTAVVLLPPQITSLNLLGGVIAPSFNSNITGYLCQASNTTVQITNLVTSPANTSNYFQINGANYTTFAASSPVLPLNLGANPLSVKIVASNGAQAIYTFDVYRAPATNSLLASLSLNQGAIPLSFDSNTFAYSVTVSNSTTDVIVSAASMDSNATVQINGGIAAVNTNSVDIALALGTNSIPVLVTAQDGTHTSTYTLAINRFAAAPLVTIQPASQITKTDAMFNASVNPLGTNASVYFQFGLDTNYGNTTASAPVGSALVAGPVSIDAGGSLAPGTTYHFRAVATNFFGTTTSGDSQFITIGVPVTLSIAESTNWPSPMQVVLAWSTNAVGAVLQASPDMTSGSWQNVTNAVGTAGSSNIVTVDATNTAQYFRLTYP